MTINDLTVLVCDDSILARKQLMNFLISIGCTNIIEAANGTMAVEIYKSQKPDLVFLDIVMPEKNGIEATREIMEYDKDAYIVMASSVGTQTNLREALKLGAKDFIQKPLNTAQIQKVLDTIIEGGC
ncbi:MAG: response regulator [Lachnospiraceae bacterium]|nr:response regulator [Lachnospiraceae bacterium]